MVDTDTDTDTDADAVTATRRRPEPGRRRLLLGAAWGLPAIGVVVATPAHASSPAHTLDVMVPEPTTRPTGADLSDVALRLTREGVPVEAEVLAVVEGAGPTFEDGATIRTLRTDAAGMARCAGLGAGTVPGVFAVVGRHTASGSTGRGVFTVVEPPRPRPFVLRDDANGVHVAIGPDGVVAARGPLADALAAAACFRFPFDPGPVADAIGSIHDDAGRCLTRMRPSSPWANPVVDLRDPDGSADQTWHVGADGTASIGAPGADEVFLADAGGVRLTVVPAGRPGVLRIVLP
ncbi:MULTISPECIES: hypothetical protein [unclassified Curtobacterium]|uniref:hypothetical protein n=1 Tax=unclassified Curtobacterium TaxID=257496 RepID=UPI000DAA4289|nr:MULTISPECIES: hypothetical protein [unclassified Curtobacterium]PZE27295.1 hypothetical protein DEI86_07345 [Curtobacterium sp. MCBD17_028]WIB63378.1 hypothetical protein DEI94_14705 [Curtobacterium sp. MCBD17_040]